MKFFKLIYTLFLSIIFLTGCGGGDPFSVVLDVDPPEHVKQLAVHCYVTDRSSVLYAGLSESRGLLDVNEEIGNVPDGNLSLYNDGAKLFDYEPNDNTDWFVNFAYDNNGPFGTKDGVMEIRASAPGYPELTATQTFPNFVPLTDLKFERDGTINIDGEKLDAVEITFKDPAGEENYYEIGLVTVDSSCISGETVLNRVYFETQNLNVERSGDYDGILLSDVGFDGSEYKIVLGTYNNFNNEEELSLVWKCISKDHYEYSRSLRAFSDNQDLGGFAQPISIFSNVENGLGIFTCGREEVYPVLISDLPDVEPNILTATFNGDDYEPCDIEAYGGGANEYFNINSNDGNYSLNLFINDLVVGVIGAGTNSIFQVNVYDNSNQQGYNTIGDGDFEITEHNEDTKFVTGTYSGTLSNPTDPNDNIEVDLMFEVTYQD